MPEKVDGIATKNQTWNNPNLDCHMLKCPKKWTGLRLLGDSFLFYQIEFFVEMPEKVDGIATLHLL